MNEKRKVSTETIIRTIVLGFALINAVLTMLGKNPLPFAEEELYEFFTTIVTVGAVLWAWWKNNSFTSAAVLADEYLATLKAKRNGTGGMAKYRSPFKASSKETCAFKKKGSWAAGYHTGVDRVCDNRALVSPANGVVAGNTYSDSYGYYVIITTDEGLSILMAHMKSLSPLKVGAKIKRGDDVGTMGSTGNSTGAHLHIEVQNSKTWAYNRNLLAPNDYIDWGDTASTSASTSTTTQQATHNASVFAVGEIVNFAGGKHYVNANAASGTAVKASLAKITAISSKDKHQVHLRAVNESGSFISGGVYGWCDISTISKRTSTAKKSVDELAKEVIAGEWGNGTDRKNRLTEAGYDYNAVQKRVNELLK